MARRSRKGFKACIARAHTRKQRGKCLGKYYGGKKRRRRRSRR